MKIGFSLGDQAYTHIFISQPSPAHGTSSQPSDSLSANAATSHIEATSHHSPKGQPPKVAIVQGTVVDYTRINLLGDAFQLAVVLRLKGSTTEMVCPISAASPTIEGAKHIVQRNLQPLED